MLFLYVAVGSALGGMLRFGVGLLAARAENFAPFSAVWSTILINVTGSFLIGYISTATAAGSRFALSHEARIFLMVGVCGGFTTFSAFSLDAVLLWERAEKTAALAYIGSSVVLSIGALLLGLFVVRVLT